MDHQFPNASGLSSGQMMEFGGKVTTMTEAFFSLANIASLVTILVGFGIIAGWIFNLLQFLRRKKSTKKM